jgi:hypothetical protein
MREAIRDDAYKHYEMFAVGLGGEVDDRTLGTVGRDGFQSVADQEKLGEAFDKVAGRIEGHMKRFYLLSYCTPARAGEHEVKITVKTKIVEGDVEAEEEWGVGDNVDPPSDDDDKKKKKKEKKKEKKKKRQTMGKMSSKKKQIFLPKRKKRQTKKRKKRGSHNSRRESLEKKSRVYSTATIRSSTRT